VRSAPVFRLAPSTLLSRRHCVVLSAALVLVLVGIYRAPNRIGPSGREAPLARVAIDVDRPGALIPPDFDGLSMGVSRRRCLSWGDDGLPQHRVSALAARPLTRSRGCYRAPTHARSCLTLPLGHTP
jgi:hypothetical protein